MPFDIFTAALRYRAFANVPPELHTGSTIAGYSTSASRQLTRKVHSLAPGAVTGRSHGTAALLSKAQSSSSSLAG